MLGQKVNPHTGKKEYCLLSISKPGRVLEWYGVKKPSPDRVEKSERRITYFKNR